VLSISLLLLLAWNTDAQTLITIRGIVRDAATQQPLQFATIGVKGRQVETISKRDGSFEIVAPEDYRNDTLIISYLGYAPVSKKISTLQSVETIYLRESATLLEEVVVVHTEIRIRDLDKALRQIRGNLYAMETEVTVAQYNEFLFWMLDQNQTSLHTKCDYDLSQYDDAAKQFFKRYVTHYRSRKDSVPVKHIAPHDLSDYPAVNVPYEGAVQFCEWLTDRYNSYDKKKQFSKVKFRLPTLREWRIAALGYEKFQTWVLEDNMVLVTIPEDSLQMTPKKGTRKEIKVGNDILYPWFGSYYYRRSPRNHKGCFLGNFSVKEIDTPCPAHHAAFDGWIMMGRTASYFPNNMGFYDVVGNVGEMIDEEGKACGGSWDDPPSESTIHSVKVYTTPNATVGFRVFMEVIQ
jgi:hypothetical protein